MTTTYVHALTEYEIEACKRDAAKRAQGCNECSQTEYEVEAYNRDVADAHTFTAATEIAALMVEIAAAKTKRNNKLAAMDAEIAELDAEIAALMVEIAAAKTKRNNKLAAMDAEIAALEAEIAAHR